MFSGHRVEGRASQREVAKSGQTWPYGLGSVTMVSCNCPCSQEPIWGVIFFFSLPRGSANGPLRLGTQFFLLFMCLASTACPFAGFCCIVGASPCASQHQRWQAPWKKCTDHPTICLRLLSNCVPRPRHFPDFPVSPGILHRHAPVSHGTFCRSLPSLALLVDVPHFTPACPADFLYVPWHPLWMCTRVPVAHCIPRLTLCPVTLT